MKQKGLKKMEEITEVAPEETKAETDKAETEEMKLRPLRDLTDKERVEIIHMSDKIGVSATANAFNVSMRTVSYCRNEYAKRKGIAVKDPRKKTQLQEASSIETTTDPTETIAKNDEEVNSPVLEAKKTDELTEAVQKNAEQKNEVQAVQKNEAQKNAELTEANEAVAQLRMENAILKEKLSALTELLEKLSNAIRNLL